MTKTYSLPAVLDITTISAAANDFRAQTSSDDIETIDLSGVERVTTPGMQLLIAIKKEFPRLTFSKPSRSILNARDQAGIADAALPFQEAQGV